MSALFLGLGLIIGAILGYFLSQRSKSDAAKTVEELSAQIVGRQTEHILQLAESKLAGKKDVIDGTLKSMKDDFRRMEDLLQKVGDGNVKVGTRLSDAAKVIKDLSDTTTDLRTALSSNSGRGQWGERMAEDVLRLSGLVEGINYIKQKKLESTGSKPDFTFLLPQNLKLNMDVKFPFNNYQQYIDTSSEKEKDVFKKAFLKDVRDRLKEVRSRDYINAEDGTADYVLLFVPNEQIFAFINEADRSIIDEAMRGKTILCSPLSLYAILAVIRQAIDNFAMESTSREMLAVFGAFKLQWEKYKDQMETVRQRFETVHNGYEELIGARTRQLDKPLEKIETMRSERGIAPAAIEEAFAKVVEKQLVRPMRVD